MFPTIRHVESHYTHEEYSVDFFGEELNVTVTPSASVTSSWINNVLFYNRFSSHALVVGVGVQWSPVSNDSNLPPNRYNGNPQPHNLYPPPHNYSADPPRNSYYAYPPRNSYYDDPSPGDYFPDPPPCSYYYEPPPDTLQLCVGDRCLIFQLSHCDHVSEDLRSFLRDPGTIFVGIWNSQDAGKLARSRHRLDIGVLHDIRHYVNDSQDRSLRCCSFEEIVQECMGHDEVRLVPEISRSDWSVYDLGRDQILQASLDAYVCDELALRVRLWEF